MSGISNARAHLLLATLQRTGRPMGTAELRDEATGLALAEGWDESQLAVSLTRRNIGALMRNLVRESTHVIEGPVTYDPEARKPVPTYQAIAPNPQAAIPAPPEEETATPETNLHGGMDQEQMLAVIEVGDQVCGAVARFMRDMQDIQVRARRDLLTKGLELPR